MNPGAAQSKRKHIVEETGSNSPGPGGSGDRQPGLYGYLIAARTNDHNHSGWKQCTYIISALEGQRSDVGLTGREPGCWQGCIPVEELEGRFHFPASGFQVSCIPWLMATSLNFKASSIASSDLSLRSD